jgi:hypothetical protein
MDIGLFINADGHTRILTSEKKTTPRFAKVRKLRGESLQSLGTALAGKAVH